MNILTGRISEIQSHEGISLVKVETPDHIIFTSVVLDTVETADYLRIDSKVKIVFKETEVIISKDTNSRISIQNRLPCIIRAVNRGIILSQVEMGFGDSVIQSIITSNACKQLELNVNDRVFALIKTNEVSLSLHD
jgi:molybdate transport system regulatory protein